MPKTPTKSEAARRGLLAVMMLAVLLASVGVAWMLERKSTIKARAGEQIISEIRAKGLKHYWPENLQIDWFLIYSKGNAIGWKASAVAKASGGTFIGADVEIVPNQYRSNEIWTLNADATAGTYHSNLLLANNKRFKTDIFLNDGAVKVVQHIRNLGNTANSDAPKNYLPEGTLLPAVRQTAEMRANAQFAMVFKVFNEKTPRNKTIDFGTVNLRYLGQKRKRQDQTVHRVARSGGGRQNIIYELDEKGKILLIQEEDVQTIAVDKQEVNKVYKNASPILWQLLEALHAGGAGSSRNSSEQ